MYVSHIGLSYRTTQIKLLYTENRTTELQVPRIICLPAYSFAMVARTIAIHGKLSAIHNIFNHKKVLRQKQYNKLSSKPKLPDSSDCALCHFIDGNCNYYTQW